jgi:thioredoxin-related protein
MKHNLILILFLSVFAIAIAAEETTELNWLSNLEEAQLESEESGLPIFVNFTGSDWCGWCIKLVDEVFSKEEFIDYANENLIMVKLDFPKRIEQTKETKDYNRSLSSKYNIQGFPTILLLNSEGEVIAKTGYQAGGPNKYIDHLKNLLEKG